jgi:hypothetical protein
MLDLSLSYDCLMITSYRWQKSYILYLKKEWWQKSYILYLKKEWLSYLCLWASKEYSVALMTTASCHEVYWSRLSFLKDTVNAVTNIVFVTRHPCTRLSHNKLQLRTHSLSWYQLQSILLLRLWEFNSKILWKLVKQSIPKTTTNFRPRPNKPRNFFFIEYGHDGYQKNPLSIQIPKKSTYLSDKMHPKQDILKQRCLRLL